jgi:hypothetical protein
MRKPPGRFPRSLAPKGSPQREYDCLLDLLRSLSPQPPSINDYIPRIEDARQLAADHPERATDVLNEIIKELRGKRYGKEGTVLGEPRWTKYRRCVLNL